MAKPQAIGAASGPKNAEPRHETRTAPDVASHLYFALAIADLVCVATGSMPDGSDSRIEELHVDTLSTAMCCIRQNLDAAVELCEHQGSGTGAH